MSDARLGTAIRLIRQRRDWTQDELGERAGVSKSTISRLERGHPDELSVATIRRVAGAIDMRVDLIGRWRAGDLDRLLNWRHSALHEEVARWFGDDLPVWILAPEVSFSIYGERGVIDILAWHPGRRALLVIELKTDISDVNELAGTADRKRRLAAQVARERGWDPVSVSLWVIVAPSRTSRRRIDDHRAMLRAAFPVDGRGIGSWLRDPAGSVAALSMWSHSRGVKPGTGLRPVRRVQRRSGPRNEGR
jgi:transcriptional regulator with XRE-family HTH domain